MTKLGESILREAERELIRNARGDRQLSALANRAARSPSYNVAYEYAERLGTLTARSMRTAVENAAPDTIPKAVIEEVAQPLLSAGHDALGNVTTDIQTNMNDLSGVGLTAQVPDLNDMEFSGFTDFSKEIDNADDSFMAAIEDFLVKQVDKTIQKNAEQNVKLGVEAKIIRKPEAARYVAGNKPVRSKKGKVYYYPYSRYGDMYKEPCPFCLERAGTYNYENVRDRGNDVYLRHKRCRCEITYVQGKFRQDVVSKAKWTEDDADGKRRAIEDRLRDQEAAETRRQADRDTKREIMQRLREELGWSDKGASIFYEKNKRRAGYVGWDYIIDTEAQYQRRARMS